LLELVAPPLEIDRRLDRRIVTEPIEHQEGISAGPLDRLEQ
jgi:hypothetical protein